MRDSSMGRGGFDRVLMAVAATFLAMSATSALAQSDAPRASAAELAIEAAIPRPQPANVPPPTADDFKLDATAAVAPQQIELPQPAEACRPKAADTKPADTKPTDTSLLKLPQAGNRDQACRDAAERTPPPHRRRLRPPPSR